MSEDFRAVRLRRFAEAERSRSASARERIVTPRRDGTFRDHVEAQRYRSLAARHDQLADDIEWALEQIK